MKDFNFLKSEPYLKPLKARTQQLCATKRSTVEGQGKALRIARNPDSRGAVNPILFTEVYPPVVVGSFGQP